VRDLARNPEKLLLLRVSDGRLGALSYVGAETTSANRLASTLRPPTVAPDQSESQAGALRKELGLTDLILATILFVVVPDFFGTAVKAGRAHVALWLFGIALFFVPQAFVVSHLNRQMPLEGGLYEWARHAFGDAIGFLVAWNLWLFSVLYAASVGLITLTYIAYAAGLDVEAVVTRKSLVFACTVVVLAWLSLAAHLGLRVGKWVSNAGSALTILTISFLALLPFLRHADYHPLRLVAPPLTLFSFSVFSKMTFGALCGLEYTAIFAGESRRPARHLTRAILIAAPLIALLYLFGSSAILAFVSPEQIDMIGPIPQAFGVALAGHRFATVVMPVAVLLLLTTYLASFTLNFAANTRLPLCAGWDHLLPAWFTPLHARYRTPINSILFLGAITLALSVLVLIGVGEQEGFALLQIWSFAFYGIAYVALFAIPVFAAKSRVAPPAFSIRILGILGLVVTLLFVALSIFPIIPVASQSAYTIKTAAALLGANVLGYALYRSLRTAM
jgi:glutamate:GABA antiporter